MKRLVTEKTYSWYDMTNNAYQVLRKAGKGKPFNIICGAETPAMLLDAAGNDMSIFPSWEQAGDSLLMGFYNPKNRDILEQARPGMRGNERAMPHLYPQCIVALINEVVYKREVCKLHWIVNQFKIIEALDSGSVVMVCRKFKSGGHYIGIVDYSVKNQTYIYMDTYKKHYKGKWKKLLSFPFTDIQKNIVKPGHNFYIEFYRQRGDV